MSDNKLHAEINEVLHAYATIVKTLKALSLAINAARVPLLLEVN